MSQHDSLKSVRTALAVVETLTDCDGCGVSELATKLDMPKSTAFEYLRTLHAEGYVRKDEDRYVCSSRFLSIGVRVRGNNHLYTVAKRELSALATEVDAHVAMMVEENGFAIPLFIERMSHSMEPVVPLGQPTYMHSHAAGKAILAYLPPKTVDAIVDRRGLTKLTDNTITDRGTLDEELAGTRKRGCAVDREEALEGLGGIAVPIFDRILGAIAGSISIYGPAGGNRDEPALQRYLHSLQQTKNTIELNLMQK